MRDPKIPRPPRMPKIPAPRNRDTEPAHYHLDAETERPAAEEDPIALMHELQAALANSGDLMVRLSTSLAQVQLALLANEHVAHTAIERSAEALDRLGKIEVHLGMAAE